MLCLRPPSMEEYEQEKGGYQSFVVAGQNQGTWSVFATLMATILGASTTLGVAAQAEQQGFIAFWWFIAGGFGLALQGIFLSRKIRETGVKTLPSLARITIGEGAQRVVAWVIAISWPGIIAAQFVAMANLLQVGLGFGSATLWIPLLGFLITFFTIWGGQRLVVGTDRIFLGILMIGFLSLFGWIIHQCTFEKFPLPNLENIFPEEIHATDLFSLFLLIGGAYFLGPDITSRTFIARNGKIARNALFLATPTLIIFGALITFSAIWAGIHLPGSGNPLLRIALQLPPISLFLFSVGLYAALISSIDTCLINAATIIASDLLGKNTIRATRLFIALLGFFGIVMALWKREIINLLLIAYSVYTPGIVAPLAMALLMPNNRPPLLLWISVAAIGGCFGIAFSLKLIPSWIPSVWMIFSLIIMAVIQIKYSRAASSKQNT